jgi:hypothetical protein
LRHRAGGSLRAATDRPPDARLLTDPIFPTEWFDPIRFAVSRLPAAWVLAKSRYQAEMQGSNSPHDP